MHPYLSVYWHRLDDPFSSYQRLFVVFTLLFSFLAINAMFFGQADGSQENALSIAIFSSLIVTPIGVVFPMLFKKAAFMIHSEREEEAFLKRLNVKLVTKPTSSRGRMLQYFCFFFLALWVSGAIFLCLIYGMQVLLAIHISLFVFISSRLGKSGVLSDRFFLVWLFCLSLTWILPVPSPIAGLVLAF
jgi:hypothetical protein